MNTSMMTQAPQQQQSAPQGQIPKLTPEKLQQFRDQKISSSSIVKLYGSLNPEFKQKYEAGASRGFSFPGTDGKPMSWDDVALNMEAFGSPAGPPQMQQAQQQQGGILQGIGNVASTIWDYATAPIDAAAGGIEAGIGKAAGALGAKGIEKTIMAGPDVQGLGENLQQTADIAPMVGGAIGSVAGPVGTGAGAFAGKAVGNLIETGLDLAQGKEQRRGVIGKVASPVVEGVVAGVTDKAVTTALNKGLPLFKKGLTKLGATLTNVSDKTLERAFNQPKMMSTAVQEISENVTQPFLKLSQQIGNTMKDKIDEAARAIGSAKDDILTNNPGARFDVSSATDDLARVLKEENLSLKMGGTAAKKDFFILNELGDPITSEAALNPSITGLVQGQAKPLADDELKGLVEYVKTVNKAEKYTIDDVLDLKKLYNRIYNELGTNDIGTTSNAQRILRKLRTTVDDKISSAMPPDLALAYKDYSKAIGAHEDFGSFLSDHKGKLELSDRAESYLNTLWGNTKGQRRQDVEELSKFLGIDINGKMQTLKDAQALSDMFPKTGGRTLDVLRTFLAKGAVSAGTTVGAIAGGVPGAAVGGAAGAGVTAVTSPLLVGKATMKAGEFAGNRIVKSFTTMMGKLAPAERQALIQFVTGASQAVDGALHPSQSDTQTGSR